MRNLHSGLLLPYDDDAYGPLVSLDSRLRHVQLPFSSLGVEAELQCPSSFSCKAIEAFNTTDLVSASCCIHARLSAR